MLVLEYQRSASKSASSTMLVTPSTNGAMMPYEVPVTQPGSAVHQKSILWVQAEREFRGCVVRHHGAMHVNGAFGQAGGATGQVQQSNILGVRLQNLEYRCCAVQQRVKVTRFRNCVG